MSGYKENPKTKGSGIMCAIPHAEKCPLNCDDCYFQSGRSFLEPLEENLPNMPSSSFENMQHRVFRINDGNDSSIKQEYVMKMSAPYQMKFYNTSIPTHLETFDAPVVLTVNPREFTDHDFFDVLKVPKNLMFVRVRTNTWNLRSVVKPAVKYYTEQEVPVVLTFMAYFKTNPKIQKDYVWRKRTLNSYWAITTEAWERVMEKFKYNKWVHSCGKIEGEKGDTHCRFCGNCLREYFATMERMRNED